MDEFSRYINGHQWFLLLLALRITTTTENQSSWFPPSFSALAQSSPCMWPPYWLQYAWKPQIAERKATLELSLWAMLPGKWWTDSFVYGALHMDGCQKIYFITECKTRTCKTILNYSKSMRNNQHILINVKWSLTQFFLVSWIRTNAVFVYKGDYFPFIVQQDILPVGMVMCDWSGSHFRTPPLLYADKKG